MLHLQDTHINLGRQANHLHLLHLVNMYTAIHAPALVLYEMELKYKSKVGMILNMQSPFPTSFYTIVAGIGLHAQKCKQGRDDIKVKVNIKTHFF